MNYDDLRLAGEVAWWQNTRRHLRRDAFEVWLWGEIFVERVERKASVYTIVCTHFSHSDIPPHRLTFDSTAWRCYLCHSRHESGPQISLAIFLFTFEDVCWSISGNIRHLTDLFLLQTYTEITSDVYLKFISNYVVGLGPGKDTVVPPNGNNYLTAPTDLVTRAHALNLQVCSSEHILWTCGFQFAHVSFQSWGSFELIVRNVMMQVHPYTYRNENKFLHFDFHQDPYQEYSYWIHNVSIDGLFTDFVGTLHLYQEWTSPLTFPWGLPRWKSHISSTAETFCKR